MSVTVKGNIKSGPALVLKSKTEISKLLSHHYYTCYTVIRHCESEGKSVTRETFLKQEEELGIKVRDSLFSAARRDGHLDVLKSFFRDAYQISKGEEDELENETVTYEDLVKTNEEASYIQEQGIQREQQNTGTEEGLEETVTENATLRVGEAVQLKHDRKEHPRQRDGQWDGNSHEEKLKPTFFLKIPRLALILERLDMMKFCVRAGLCISKFRFASDQTLLYLALQMEHVDESMVDYLLDHIPFDREAPKTTQFEKYSPISACLMNGRINCQKKLRLIKKILQSASKGGKQMDLSGEPVLQEFAFSFTVCDSITDIDTCKEIVREMIKSGADINFQDSTGATALVLAIKAVLPASEVEEISIYKAEDDESRSRKLKIQLVQYFLEIGADPNLADNEGNTAVHAAMSSLNLEPLKLVLKHGGNPNILNNIGLSPLHFRCCHGDWSDDEEIIEFFKPMLETVLVYECNLNTKALDRSTALHIAACQHAGLLADCLILQGASVNAKDYIGRAPLHMAVRNSSTEVIGVLLQHGANIDERDQHGDTPLSHACLFSNTPAARVLLENGSNPCSVGDLGIQPVHLAAENGDAEMMSLLLEAGADINAADESGSTPLHYAASDGNPDTTEFLLKYGADKSVKDHYGRTPLFLSSLRGTFGSASLLAESPLEVRFGNLPPGIFPNRPSLEIDDIDNFYDGLHDTLKKMRTSPLEIAKTLLECPGLGRVYYSEGENQKIFATILEFAQKVAERIAELDPLFKGTVMNAGSSFEKVKVGYADEFDFSFHLERISQHVDRLESTDTAEFASIMMKEDIPKEIERFCVSSTRILNSATLFRYFSQILRRAVYDVMCKPMKHLYVGSTVIAENQPLFIQSDIPLSKLQSMTLTWYGPLYKHMDISVDFNPVLFSPTLPDGAIQSCNTVPNLDKMGVYLIPKKCDKVFTLPSNAVPITAYVWRYSIHHLEEAVMRALPPLGRDCYMLCKLFRLEPLSCSVRIPSSNRIYGDWDKNNQMRPTWNCSFNLHMFQKTNPNSDAEDDTEDYDDADVQENVYNNDDDEEEEEEEEEEDAEEIMKMIQTLKEEHETEMNAESAFPSYYLKSIFLVEADRLMAEKGTFTSDDLYRVPLTVYQKLLHAVETEDIRTLFFPEENIYRHHVDNPAAKGIRHTFCKCIHNLLQKVFS